MILLLNVEIFSILIEPFFTILIIWKNYTYQMPEFGSMVLFNYMSHFMNNKVIYYKYWGEDHLPVKI